MCFCWIFIARTFLLLDVIALIIASPTEGVRRFVSLIPKLDVPFVILLAFSWLSGMISTQYFDLPHMFGQSFDLRLEAGNPKLGRVNGISDI